VSRFGPDVAATPLPSATGTPIPRRRRLTSRQAPRKNGADEYTITGSVSARLASRMSCSMSVLMLPSAAR